MLTSVAADRWMRCCGSTAPAASAAARAGMSGSRFLAGKNVVSCIHQLIKLVTCWKHFPRQRRGAAHRKAWLRSQLPASHASPSAWARRRCCSLPQGWKPMADSSRPKPVGLRWQAAMEKGPRTSSEGCIVGFLGEFVTFSNLLSGHVSTLPAACKAIAARWHGRAARCHCRPCQH